MHAAQSSPQPLRGLGVYGADTGGHYSPQQGPNRGHGAPQTPPRNPNRRGGSAPVSPSPQRTAPTPLRGSPANAQNPGHLPASPTSGLGRGGNGSPSSSSASPQRFRIANPDPAPPPSQPQGGNGFSLRPTHNFNTRQQYTATSFSSLPPPAPQSAFSPASSSPLKPRPDYENRGDNGVEHDVSDVHDAQILKARLRPSKSSEILRKLTRNENKNSYQPISDDEAEDEEKLRRPQDSPRTAVRSSSGAATSLAPPGPPSSSSSWNLSKERIVSDFPAPPAPSTPYAQQSTDSLNSSTPHASEETFMTANGFPLGSTDSVASTNSTPKANRRKSMPYPASAAPESDSRPLSYGGGGGVLYPGRHSRDDALLAAETGGMIRLNNDGYSQGDSPGTPVTRRVAGARSGLSGSPRSGYSGSPLSGLSSSPRMPQALPTAAPDYPPSVPAQPNRHSAGSEPRFDFSRPKSGLTPQSTAQHTPQSTPSAESDPTGWGQDAAGPRRRHGRSNSDGIALLARQGTLFHPASSTERASQELDVMLGKPRSRRLSANALLPVPDAPKSKVRLEASKKSRARVELDVVIEREAVVEGGDLRGRFEVVVRGGKRGHGLRVGAGKIRVVGYEEVGGNGGTRHIFFQHQYPLPVFQNHEDSLHTSLFADDADEEGFHLAVDGTHAIPFSCPLPVGGGAKGSFTSAHPKGPNVRYVVVGSIKLHLPKTGKRAIAHFYRPLVVLPYHNPAAVLSPALEPIVEYVENGLGWSISGEKGRVFIQVALGRRIWVAGQRVWCEIGVRNDSNKKINKCALAILQTVTTYGGPNGAKCKSGSAFESTERRKVSEEVTEADFMDVGSGHITGKSWWTGLEPGEASRWDMSVPIPTGMLSIPRSRYVEVAYVLRVTLNGSVFVDVPIELINFLSIDPPPMPSDTRHMRGRMPVRARAPEQYHVALSHAPEPPMSEPAGAMPLAEPRERAAVPIPLSSSPAAASLESIPEPYSRSDASPTLGANNPSMGYTTEQLQTAGGNNMAARHSSTTLNIDAILAEQQQRDAKEARMPEVSNAITPSPSSQYSSSVGAAHLAVPTANSRDLRHKVSQEFSDVHSIDEEERNHLAAEENRREGREKSLAVLQQGDNDATEYLENASEVSHDLDPEDQRVFAPATEPTGDAFELDQSSEDGSVVDDSDNERTPVVSPITTPVLQPRAAFLHHISEEEEPFDDDTFDEMMSSEGHGSHLRYLPGDENDEDDDDLLAAQDSSDVTPRVSRYEATEMPGQWGSDGEAAPRRSLEDRLARACSSTPNVGTVGAAGGAATQGHGDTDRPVSIDYNEPLDIDGLSLAEHDTGYDADTLSEKGVPFGRSSPFIRHGHSLSLPGGMSLKRTPPPALPSPGSARDISWGAQITGRTASGKTAVLNLDDETPVATPTSATFGTAPHSPRHFGEEDQTVNPSLAALYADEMSLRAPDRSVLTRVEPSSPVSKGSSSGHSFRSAEGGELPPLARSATSSESASSDGVESPPTQSQPVYASPLPVPPAPHQDYSSNRSVPDRFRPPPAMSEESHGSYEGSTVSTVQSELLPSVKARTQQIETREEALRKFTVAGSTGLPSPSRSEFSTGPLSPALSGSHTPTSNRRSYTSALAPRPTTPSRATVTKVVSSPSSGLEMRSPREALMDFTRHQEEQLSHEDQPNTAARMLARKWSTSSTSTTATDLERTIASPVRSPLLGPRGPRQLRPARDMDTTHESVDTHETQWTQDTHDPVADFNPPHAVGDLDSSSFRSSPAHTLERSSIKVPEVTSQRASLEDMPSTSNSPPFSSDSHEVMETLSDETGSASDFGSTGWTGGGRLPAMRLPQVLRG